MFARVQLTIYTSVGSDNGLALASDKPLSFCTLCLEQSVHLRNRTVTSLDLWILHWRRSHWCLKSPVTQLDCCSTDCLGKHQRQRSWPFVRGIHRWLMGSPDKKPVTQPPLGQCWYNVGIQPLAQCCANVGPTLVCQRWVEVGTTLAHHRWATVGPTQRKGWRWANVGPTSQC